MTTGAFAAFAAARELGDLGRWLAFHDGALPVTPVTFPWLSPPAQRAVRCAMWAVTASVQACARRSRSAVDAVAVADVLVRVVAFLSVEGLLPADAGYAPRVGRPMGAAQPEAGAWGFSLVRVGAGSAHIAVRVVTANATFGSDELNALYGRHGFVRAALVQAATGAPVAAAASSGEDATVAGRDAITIEGWNAPLYRLHFVVTLESPSAAESAVAEVFNAQVDFAAFAAQQPAEGGAGDDLLALSELPPVDVASAPSFSLAGGFFAMEGVGDATAGGATGGDGGFVPDLAVDNVPYHTTADQLREHFSQFGTVTRVSLATSDRSGAFLGCALVRMATFAEAVRAGDMHGKVIGGEEVVVGVLDPELNIVSILDSGIVLQEASRGGGVSEGAGMAVAGMAGMGQPSRSDWGGAR